MNSEFKAHIITPILIIVVFALIITLEVIPADTFGANDSPYLAAVIVQLITIALPTLFYCMMRGKKLTGNLRLRLPKSYTILYTVFVTLFLICGVALISIIEYSIAPGSFETTSATEYASLARRGGFFNEAYLIITFCLLPAVSEELLFRGVVLAEYEKNGVFMAVIMSVLYFSMSHFSLSRLPVYIFSGIVLASAAYATRSVFVTMLIHMLNNTVVLYAENYVLRLVDRRNSSLMLMLIILAGVFMISGVVAGFEAYRVYRTYAVRNVDSDYRVKRKSGLFSRIQQNFFSPTFLITVIMYVGFIIYKMRK